MTPQQPTGAGMQTAPSSPLGRATQPADRYDPALLFPIARAEQRSRLGLGTAASLPFFGADLWTAFELCWLNPRGKPMLAIANLTVPCEEHAHRREQVAEAVPEWVREHTLCRCAKRARPHPGRSERSRLAR